ncbi:hypothetical protein [Paenibacillus agricola]|uniref:Uncharacterized protein n=1 Tax=Paenibacillus agricola TaxID=2716264 RepID=A0ABX0JF94_9BACL|nr:hypothetical protein [Paenibacillus agricola]NHN33567.1 hypothetical protein [Paenibacillus agricola]
MNRRLEQAVNDTVNELRERGIDVSRMQDEIGEIIDDRWPHYEADRDWEDVAKQLGLF